MKRGAPLRRRSAMKRSRPTRNWQDARRKVETERRCRVCGADPFHGGRLEAAHVIGRENDEEVGGVLWVNPLDVVPLCGGCHRAYDARELDLLPYLTVGEQARAVQVAGGIAAALRRVGGPAGRGRTQREEDQMGNDGRSVEEIPGGGVVLSEQGSLGNRVEVATITRDGGVFGEDVPWVIEYAGDYVSGHVSLEAAIERAWEHHDNQADRGL